MPAALRRFSVPFMLAAATSPAQPRPIVPFALRLPYTFHTDPTQHGDSA